MKTNNSKVLLSAFLAILVFSSIACQDLYGRNENIKGSGDVITREINVSQFTGVHLSTTGKMYVEYGDKEALKIEADDNLIEYIEVTVSDGKLIIKTRENYSLKPTHTVIYYVTIREINYMGTSSSGDIFAPDIKSDNFEISVSSSGDITAGNMEATALKVRISSSGDVNLKDITADKLSVAVTSSGDFNTENVNSPIFKADIMSSGDIKIASLSTSEISASISSSGDIMIERGSTRKLDVSISSSGDYRAPDVSSEEAEIRISSSGDAYVFVNDYLKANLSSSGSVYFKGDPSIVSKERSSGRIRRSN